MSIDKLKTKYITGTFINDVKHYFTKINEIIDWINTHLVSSGVNSVTGSQVDNTDPLNPVINKELSGLTTNTIPKATASDTIGNSQITDDGTTVSIIDMKIGRGNNSIATNTGLGAQTFDAITTGSNNVAVGFASGKLTTTGQYNTSVGSTSLQNNTTGQLNTAVGFGALLSNTTGSFNEAFGYQALQSNTTGTDNCAFGYSTLNQNTTAMLNSGFGHATLQVNTTGTKNSGFGAYALSATTDGNFNTAIGQNSMGSNIHGSQNTALGLNSLFTNNADGNVALGFAAGFYETGSNKLFIDNAFRNDEADARVKSLVYGVFGATPSDQKLTINAIFNLPITTNASPQNGDIWNDGTHLYVRIGGVTKQLDN